MISIEKCKKELEKEGARYSKEEIEKIRDILYRLANIEYEEYRSKKISLESKKLKILKSVK